MMEKQRVLFLCTYNSARSQIAEGLLRHLFGEEYEAFSAGVSPLAVSSYAVTVMSEIGIDISKQRAKSVEDFRQMRFDSVITVCDNAKETCPFFPDATEVIHKAFDNPSGFGVTEEEILNGFRRIRDEIKNHIIEKFGKV
ncbi:MAG: arsenate reductase ArsC [Planctomycetota bacterium]